MNLGVSSSLRQKLAGWIPLRQLADTYDNADVEEEDNLLWILTCSETISREPTYMRRHFGSIGDDFGQMVMQLYSSKHDTCSRLSPHEIGSGNITTSFRLEASHQLGIELLE